MAIDVENITSIIFPTFLGSVPFISSFKAAVTAIFSFAFVRRMNKGPAFETFSDTYFFFDSALNETYPDSTEL